MNRPATPKCAPLETALLVPLLAPNSAIGARNAAPMAEPAMTEEALDHQLSPNRIGKEPKMMML